MRKSKITRPAQVYELKITLCGSKPSIWRTVAVSSDMRLNDLHDVIQIVMGWTNSHLHQFIVSNDQPKPKITHGEIDFMRKSGQWDKLMERIPRDRCWSDPRMEIEYAEDERKVKLSEVESAVKSKFIYEYDFGDSWEHLIEVVEIGPPAEGVKYPVCLAGKLACPPDDCGGLGGYYNMLETLKDPKNKDYEDMIDWIGEDFDPERFDIDEINAILAKWIR